MLLSPVSLCCVLSFSFIYNFVLIQKRLWELLLLCVRLMLWSVVLSVCLVEVEEGVESVQLPFRTTGDLPEDTTVEWKRYEPKYMIVHKNQNGSDQLGEQNEFHRDRTEMNDNLLKTGDISLTLKNPTNSDTGRYICDVGGTQIYRWKTVLVTVKGLFLCLSLSLSLWVDSESIKCFSMSESLFLFSLFTFLLSILFAGCKFI